MFAGIILKTFWYVFKYDENENCVKTTVANIVFTTNIHYLLKGTEVEGVIL